MFELTKIITAMIMPPFNVLLLWLLALILGFFDFKKLAATATFLGIFILYAFSIPYTSQKLGDSLVEEDGLSLADYRSAQAIVVLGGGLRDSKELYHKLATNAIQLERLRYAAYLQKETNLPLLATGSAANGTSEAQVMARELQDFFHVPTKWVESQAKTTKENARYTKQILEKEGIKRIIVVTNQWHMQRAKMLFEREGFEVLPASVGAGVTPDFYGLNVMHFVPQAGAMHSNMLALKEWIGYWKEKYL
ncbi:hypothetical protein A4G20_04605 [Pasteurellaceae bacterium RH1A]|nr:hypothetical protein A4G20_04605 [Pasteurellaceae bacterium RH1A]